MTRSSWDGELHIYMHQQHEEGKKKGNIMGNHAPLKEACWGGCLWLRNIHATEAEKITAANYAIAGVLRQIKN